MAGKPSRRPPIALFGTDRLVVRGVYGWVRHPMLAAGLLFLLTSGPSRNNLVYTAMYAAYMFMAAITRNGACCGYSARTTSVTNPGWGRISRACGIARWAEGRHAGVDFRFFLRSHRVLDRAVGAHRRHPRLALAALPASPRKLRRPRPRPGGCGCERTGERLGSAHRGVAQPGSAPALGATPHPTKSFFFSGT